MESQTNSAQITLLINSETFHCWQTFSNSRRTIYRQADTYIHTYIHKSYLKWPNVKKLLNHCRRRLLGLRRGKNAEINIFRRVQKTGSVGAEVMLCGRLFQSRERCCKVVIVFANMPTLWFRIRYEFLCRNPISLTCCTVDTRQQVVMSSLCRILDFHRGSGRHA